MESATTEAAALEEEVERYLSRLQEYGIVPNQLPANTPRKWREREQAGQAAASMAADPRCLALLGQNQPPPLEDWAVPGGVEGAFLSRYRPYITALTILRSGEYPLLLEKARFADTGTRLAALRGILLNRSGKAGLAYTEEGRFASPRYQGPATPGQEITWTDYSVWGLYGGATLLLFLVSWLLFLALMR